MSLRGRTVLVTGGTGFIGGRLVEKLVLDEGCRVRVLVRNFANAARISPYPLGLVGGDLGDREAVEAAVRGCDVVFHCAYDFVSTLAGQQRTGVEGTRNIAEAALAEGVERLVHLSTMAVYEPLAPGDVTEESPWPPSDDPYVLVKREAENLLSELHRTRTLPVVTLQPTIVYGPFSTFWTLGPVGRLRDERVQVPLLDGGGAPCNAVFVDDVADAMILAATRPHVEGERFLISAEEPVTWKRFYQSLEAAVGVRSTVDMSVEEIRRLRHR
jgi:nucleoside-diphosphate-sugar epimerase